MFQHIVYSLANRQGLFAYVRTCKTRLDTTTKFMVVVTSLFNLVILSFPDNMFYHVWTWLLIYHDGSNNAVQVCSSIKPRTVCSNMHEQACQQLCSSCAFLRVYCYGIIVQLAGQQALTELASQNMWSSLTPNINRRLFKCCARIIFQRNWQAPLNVNTQFKVNK